MIKHFALAISAAFSFIAKEIEKNHVKMVKHIVAQLVPTVFFNLFRFPLNTSINFSLLTALVKSKQHMVLSKQDIKD